MIGHTSIYNVREEASIEFYDELSEKVLAKASYLQLVHGKPVQLDKLRSDVKINYKALTKALEIIVQKGFVEIIKNSEKTDYVASDVLVKVTRDGELSSRKYLHKKAFR